MIPRSSTGNPIILFEPQLQNIVAQGADQAVELLRKMSPARASVPISSQGNLQPASFFFSSAAMLAGSEGPELERRGVMRAREHADRKKIIQTFFFCGFSHEIFSFPLQI